MPDDAPFSFNDAALASVAAEARSWVGTPYRHRGRIKGQACDCIGLPVCVGQSLGLCSEDAAYRYSELPKGSRVEKEIDLHYTVLADLREAPAHPSVFRPGVVVAFFYADRAEMQHFAILAEHPIAPGCTTMIHALRRSGKVVEARIDPFDRNDFWTRRLLKVYAMPGTVESLK
jgi:cell wall-associated NlpC family hydrolase